MKRHTRIRLKSENHFQKIEMLRANYAFLFNPLACFFFIHPSDLSILQMHDRVRGNLSKQKFLFIFFCIFSQAFLHTNNILMLELNELVNNSNIIWPTGNLFLLLMYVTNFFTCKLSNSEDKLRYFPFK